MAEITRRRTGELLRELFNILMPRPTVCKQVRRCRLWSVASP